MNTEKADTNEQLTTTTARVSTIVCEIGKFSSIDPTQDFYEAGVTSVAALTLLMELESAFEVSIPDDQFIGARTVQRLAEVIVGLANA